MNLQPQGSFTVVRQIADHTDTGTYYVQAVIRNAYTDAIIDTLQLTSRGDQRYSKNWQVPADSSGQGFYISIVTSVYTDSGYTTKSSNYGDEESTYLIQDRVVTGLGGGGGLDAFAVRQILVEELDKRAPTLDSVFGAIGALQREVNRIPKESAEMRWDDILKAIQDVRSSIKEPEEANFAPVLEGLSRLEKAIQDKEVTPVTDLAPILDKMCGDKEDTQLEMSEMKQMLTDFAQHLEERISKNIMAVIKNTNFVTSFITHASGGVDAPVEEKGEPIDVNKLAT